MSVRICTSEYMLSTVNGVGLRRNWFPGPPVRERFLTSTKDGEISRSPDPVTMIDGDLTWLNSSPDPVVVAMLVGRAPRSIVAQNPSSVVIHDAWSHASGKSPVADYPSVTQDAFGGSAQVNRQSTEAKSLKYGRVFIDGESSQVWVPCGELQPNQVLHFRYVCSVQTPGVWTAPSEFEPRWEAHALWARLSLFSGPVGSA